MIIETILLFLPAVIALIAESVIVKWAISAIAKVKETNELKAVIEQNKVLIAELKESRKLNKQLLTKIDGIVRNEEE